MKPEELARENHKFFYVDFAMGLMEENGYFNHIISRATRIQDQIDGNDDMQRGVKPLPSDRFGSMSF